MIEYIKYCYKWVKYCGFVKSKTWSYSFDLFEVKYSEEDAVTEYFKTPTQFFKDRKEKESWIQAAKDLKRGIKVNGSYRGYVQSPEYTRLLTKYNN